MTLRTGPLPSTGSTRRLSPSSSTRDMSEAKMAVAPPAGAAVIVTVLAFMASRFGRLQTSSGAGKPGGAACRAALPAVTARMREGKRRLRREYISLSFENRCRGATKLQEGEVDSGYDACSDEYTHRWM